MRCPHCQSVIAAGETCSCKQGGARAGRRPGESAGRLPPTYRKPSEERQKNTTCHYLTCSPLPPVWIKEGQPITVGRTKEAKLRLEGTLISREHAVFTLEDNHVVVRDLASSNGTQVNETRIEQATLTPGDVVTIGSWRFTYRTSHGSMPFASIIEDDSLELKTERISARSLHEALQLRQSRRKEDSESQGEDETNA